MIPVKRKGFIYEDICNRENIKEAILKSSLGKRYQKRVATILSNMDYYIEEIRNMLLEYRYEPSPYITKAIMDGANKKERIICKPNYYPDQIIHWALMLQIQPIIMHGMYEYSCGSVPKRGTSYGQKAIKKWLRADPKNTKYCLKLDIKKFYPSIDNSILKGMFRQKIKDNRCLWLIDKIIDSSKGLPIGNYTSQWFSNFFLEGLDHYIKETLGVKYYVRYVDDLVILGANKRKLHKTMTSITEYLTAIKLKPKENWQVFKLSSRPIDFLGLKFYRNRITLRKRTALRIMRRMRKISKKKKLNPKDACAVISYWGWVLRSNSYKFYHKHIRPVASIRKAKRTVSRYAKANSLR